MKPLTIILGVVCLSLCLVSSGATGAVKQETFPLTCMPSRDYPMTLNADDLSRTSVHAEVVFRFQRSAGNVAAGLRPGQCAWRDRRVSDAEPNFVCAQLPINRPGSRLTIDTSPTPSGPRLVINVNGSESVFNRLLNFAGVPITFQARQVGWPTVPGGRCLEMTPIP
jgi:hypothetical protein